MACVIGHIFPVFYGFRGGKGVVTAAAMIAFTDWRVFLLVLLTFAVMFAWKRIVSLASVTCAATYPVLRLPPHLFPQLPPGRRAPVVSPVRHGGRPVRGGSRCSSSTTPTSAASSGGRRSPSSWAGKSDPSRRKPGPDFHDYFVSSRRFCDFSPGFCGKGAVDVSLRLTFFRRCIMISNSLILGKESQPVWLSQVVRKCDFG